MGLAPLRARRTSTVGKLTGSVRGDITFVDPILGAILIFVGLSLLYTYIGGVKAVTVLPLPRMTTGFVAVALAVARLIT